MDESTSHKNYTMAVSTDNKPAFACCEVTSCQLEIVEKILKRLPRQISQVPALDPLFQHNSARLPSLAGLPEQRAESLRCGRLHNVERARRAIGMHIPVILR
jgi:hypothetical protein